MRIFVTGATGVLGRRVVPLLVDAGHEVTAVGRTPDKRALLESEGARAVTVDLFDPEAVRIAVGGADAILNLATAVPPAGLRMFLPASWHEMDRVRRQVSTNLVDAALAGDTVERLIQESFAPIYADGGQAWLDETAAVQPARYNRSALDAEANAERFTQAGRIGVVLRFGMLYGLYDAATDQLIDAIRRGWFPLFGQPEAYCSWAEHGDAAEAVVASLRVPAGIYNVVESQPLTRQDLGDGIARLLAVRPPRFLPPWAANLGGVLGETLARSLRISSRKLEQASGWAPRYRTALVGFAAIIAAEEEQKEVRRSFRGSGSVRRHARR
jgi:nucleoside-diphosphate-sugar epimerase